MDAVINKATIDSLRVKNCWQKIKSSKGADFFIDDFYQFMFKQHPDVLALFPKNLAEQKTKLLTTLDNVINGIDYINELKPALIELGELHQNIGIEKEMFDPFISIIIEAANTASDYNLTNEELNAWKNAFREISDIMLEGYK